jgi:nucleotide-binding universal stress UspA family protein
LSLCEMGEYCLARRTHLETGCVCGSVRKVLLPYARKWQADLIVMGVQPGNRLLRWILGSTALQLMKKLRCGVYAAS